MNLEEFLLLLQEDQNTKREEKRYLFIKAQIGSKKEKESATKRLREVFLPFTIRYLEKYKETFPLDIQSENDAFDVIEDGFLFLCTMIDESINRGEGNFSSYFTRKLNNYMSFLKREREKEQGNLEDLINDLSPLSVSFDECRYEHDVLDFFQMVETEIKNLSPIEQYAIIKRYELEKKQSNNAKMEHVNMSDKKLKWHYKMGIEHLRNNIYAHDSEVNETFVYQYVNKLKVIK